MAVGVEIGGGIVGRAAGSGNPVAKKDPKKEAEEKKRLEEQNIRNQKEQMLLKDLERKRQLSRIEEKRIREPLEALDQRIERTPVRQWKEEELKGAEEGLKKLDQIDQIIARFLGSSTKNSDLIGKYKQIIGEELKRREPENADEHVQSEQKVPGGSGSHATAPAAEFAGFDPKAYGTLVPIAEELAALGNANLATKEALSDVATLIEQSGATPEEKTKLLHAVKYFEGAIETTPTDFEEQRIIDVVNNSMLSDDARVAKAAEILGIELTKEQQKALLAAHVVGQGEEGKQGKAGVFNYKPEHISEKARILVEAFTKDQRRALMEAGIVGVGAPAAEFAPGTFNPADYGSLQPIAEELAVVGAAGLATESALEDFARRIVQAPAPVTQAEKAMLLPRVRDFEDAAERAEAQRRQGGRRGREGELPEEVKYLKQDTIKDKDGNFIEGFNIDPTNFHSAPVNAQAAQIKTDIEAEGVVDNDYFIQKIDEISPMAGNTTIPQEQQDEARRLLQITQRLKDALIAQQETFQSQEHPGLYGEIRMSAERQAALIELALAANPDAQAGTKEWAKWQEVQQRFNVLFKSADVDSSHEWREALGQSGQLEVSEFHNVLSRAAENRILPNGRVLNSDDQEKLRRMGRIFNDQATLRENLHVLTYLVNRNFGTEDVAKFAKSFTAEQADTAFRLPGVTAAAHFYENAMFAVIAKNGGALPYEAMVNKRNGEYGDVEAIVNKQMETTFPDMPDWERRRAISIARGMGIVTARHLEIACVAMPATDTLVSWWANSIVKNIAFFRQVARYNVGYNRNKILAFKLENNSVAWSKRELEEIGSLSTKEILNRFTNEDEQNRYIDMVNPFRIGSVFTQTGWRWRDDKIQHGGAIAWLLDGYKFNPIIGTGLWVEKQRGAMESKEKLNEDDIKEANDQLGTKFKNGATEGQLAKAVIEKNLELTAKITPLKLFNNMVGLRQRVLRSEFIKTKYDRAIRTEKYYDKAKENGEQYLITSKELESDLQILAVAQHGLSQDRSDAYKPFLEELHWRRENGIALEFADAANPDERLRASLLSKRPDLYNEEHTNLHDKIHATIVTSIDPDTRRGQEDQARRVVELAEYIKHEFHKPEGMHKLVYNLEHKGWKVPFIFGTDDIPYDLYSFVGTGGNSFDRRWGSDINSVAKGAAAYEGLIVNMTNYHSQEDILKQLYEVWNNVRGHDEGVAYEVMERTIEGICKFYKKDILNRLPGGIGKIRSFVGGKASYAQVAFGRHQMAWDELDIHTFVHKAESMGLFANEEMAEKVKKRVGAENWNLFLAMSRTAVPFVILAYLYYLFSDQMSTLKKGGSGN